MPVSKRLVFNWLVFLCVFGLVSGGAVAQASVSGNMIRIKSIEPGTGNTGFVFPVVEVTDDTGLDGEADTGDEGENDGFPDEGENLELIGSDTITITLGNEPRQGVVDEPDGGRPLFVDSVILTYYDSTGATPLYAPQRRFYPGLEIAPDGEGSVELVAVPFTMKVPANASVRGLRAMFLYPVDAAEFALAQGLRVHIYVNARDLENEISTSASAESYFTFINPNVGGAVGQ